MFTEYDISLILVIEKQVVNIRNQNLILLILYIYMYYVTYIIFQLVIVLDNKILLLLLLNGN